MDYQEVAMLSVLINGICGQMGRNVYVACQAQSGQFSALPRAWT